MRHTFTLLSLFLLPLFSLSQVKGRVWDAETQEALVGAVVHFDGSTTGSLTDEEGRFVLDAASYPQKLIVSMLEYQADTIEVQAPGNIEIKLKGDSREPVVITGNLKPTRLSRSPVKVEVLSRQFLRQLPSNNVMEVIDYVNGVNKQINCGVCGTNDIHINGMEGPYTLVLIDGMPIIGSLGSVYGLNGIPSSLIERIEIVKGPGSTLYGTDAVAGIINIITRDADQVPSVDFSGFVTSDQEVNLDMAIAPRIGKVKTLISGNYYSLDNRIDDIQDNFTDIPLSERLALFSKFQLDRPDNKTASLALRYYTEDRFGGVLNWQPENRGSDSIYGESIETDRFEVLGSYALPGKEALRLDYSFAHHDQDSYYGDSYYKARQQNGFAGLIWHKNLGERHSLVAGSALRYQYYDDNTPATADASRRYIPGIYAEDEIKLSSKLTTLAGLRLDHNRDHGVIVSPRLNARWQPGTWTTFRVTGGTGFRNVNLFTEDHAALTGARTVVVEGELAPERSYNVNATWSQVLNLGASAANLDVDVFYTYFLNKIIPDYDTDPNLIVYRNLTGHSIIRGAAFKFSQSFEVPLHLEVGGTFLDVYAVDANGEQSAQEFAPSFSGVFSLGYDLKKLRSRIDYTGQVVGPMHLPTYPEPLSRPETSEWFSVQNIMGRTQLGHGISIQYGVRNLFNYTQNSPLIRPDAPFSGDFDTAYAYGPLQGRRYLLGMQWELGKR